MSPDPEDYLHRRLDQIHQEIQAWRKDERDRSDQLLREFGSMHARVTALEAGGDAREGRLTEAIHHQHEADLKQARDEGRYQASTDNAARLMSLLAMLVTVIVSLGPWVARWFFYSSGK